MVYYIGKYNFFIAYFIIMVRTQKYGVDILETKTLKYYIEVSTLREFYQLISAHNII
jgi:hypothetical protein